MGGDVPREDQERLSALLEASGSVLRYRRFEDAARSIFDSCKKLTGASAGYVALLGRDGTENEVLFLDSGGLPCTVDPSLPMPIRGLRAEVYRAGKTAYDNDFPNSEWLRFLPEGHAELHNVLFAPLTIEGRTLGLLGLANKPGGFTEDDARMAAAFGELAAVALYNSRTLEALENSERHFRSLVETAGDAIISADSCGNIILWNRRAETMFGYRADEAMGKPLTSIMPERFRHAHEKGMKMVLSTGESRIIGETIELAGLRRHGSEFPLELAVAKWSTGEETFFTAVIRDITERKRADEALRYHAALLTDLSDGVIATDKQWLITAWNPAAEALFGWKAEEVLGKSSAEILTRIERDGRPFLREESRRALADTGRFRAELTYYRRNGTPVEVESSAVAIHDGQGRPVGYVTVLRDITERKRAEEDLQNLATFPGENPNPIIRVAADGTVIFANGSSRPLLELWGCEEGASLPPEPYQWVESALSTDKLVTCETVCGDRTFLVICAPIAGRDYVNIYGLDITERKRMEEELRQHREDLSHAQAVAHIGSWRLDVRRSELTWSDETYRMFGIPKGTPMTYEAFLEAVHPDDREYVEKEWSAALRGEPYNIEHRIVVDDTVRWVRERAELEFDNDGALLSGFGTVQDITERKQAEEALDRLRTEFMGMVTHELKTPLTAIKGSAATALGSQRPLAAEENRELFEIIDEQADRLRELMDNLLDVTRVEAGTLSVSPEPIDLRAVFEEARATFARGGGLHQVRLEVPVDMPHVHADRRRLFQVLMNLLNNAGMFSSPTEPITIAAERDSLQVTVHVRDRGRGIPKEKLPLLFKKFSRLHDDAGQRLSGTGLGLAICKGIVEAHGGRIWAESVGECQGSTFSFTLPVASEVSVKALSDEARRAVHLGRVRRPTEKTRVLAVDDEPQILRFLRRSLDEAGYQAIVTADPCEVAKLVELEEPDLVLLDLVLPGTSGFELLQRIREFSGVPVIFLTASDREEDAVRALKEGADDYITKPFSPSELLARIGAALRRRVLPDVMEARPAFSLHDLTIDFVERRVTVAGQEVVLSATEYKILHQLATHAGRPLSYEQLLRQVWGPEYSQETELVRSFIRNLRRKLGDDARNPRFILTERQVGYRMLKS